jgi:hypothetical protein
LLGLGVLAATTAAAASLVGLGVVRSGFGRLVLSFDRCFGFWRHNHDRGLSNRRGGLGNNRGRLDRRFHRSDCLDSSFQLGGAASTAATGSNRRLHLGDGLWLGSQLRRRSQLRCSDRLGLRHRHNLDHRIRCRLREHPQFLQGLGLALTLGPVGNRDRLRRRRDRQVVHGKRKGLVTARLACARSPSWDVDHGGHRAMSLGGGDAASLPKRWQCVTSAGKILEGQPKTPTRGRPVKVGPRVGRSGRTEAVPPYGMTMAPAPPVVPL